MRIHIIFYNTWHIESWFTFCSFLKITCNSVSQNSQLGLSAVQHHFLDWTFQNLMAKGDSSPCLHFRSRCVKSLPSWDSKTWQLSLFCSQSNYNKSEQSRQLHVLALGWRKRLVEEGKKLFCFFLQIQFLSINDDVALGWLPNHNLAHFLFC